MVLLGKIEKLEKIGRENLEKIWEETGVKVVPESVLMRRILL